MRRNSGKSFALDLRRVSSFFAGLELITANFSHTSCLAGSSLSVSIKAFLSTKPFPAIRADPSLSSLFSAGFGCSGGPRDSSFCGHVLLQKSDEPVVVLDALKDWRFEKVSFLSSATRRVKCRERERRELTKRLSNTPRRTPSSSDLLTSVSTLDHL